MLCWRDKIIEKCSGQKNHINKYLELGTKPLKTLKVLEIKLVKKNVPLSEISNMLAVGKCLLYESQVWFFKICEGGTACFFGAVLLRSDVSFYWVSDSGQTTQRTVM